MPLHEMVDSRRTIARQVRAQACQLSDRALARVQLQAQLASLAPVSCDNFGELLSVVHMHVLNFFTTH